MIHSKLSAIFLRALETLSLERPHVDATPGQGELPANLATLLRRKVNYLMMIPAVATEALQVAQDPEVRITDLATLIERDVKLAADMLHQANSVAFAGSRPVANLRQAAMKLGLEQIRQLIISSSMFSMMEKMQTGEERARLALTRHSQLTGSLCVTLNRELSAGFQGEEFTAGFIHDFGRVLLATAFPEEFSKADPVDFQESTAILQRERDVIGASHCDVGAWFAKQNRFPDSLVAVALHHHDPARAGDQLRLAALVATADDIANHIARMGAAKNYNARSNPFIALVEKSGIKAAAKTFAKKLPAILEAADRAIA